MKVLLYLVGFSALLFIVKGGCPFANQGQKGTSHLPIQWAYDSPHLEAYYEALSHLNWDEVKADIRAVLTDSKSFWPADFGNYAGLMIRHAWHCAGSYRIFDGLGGCDGARQRFEPEQSWPDNTNLDKARRLLWPIKKKYGLGLSWGDLIILTGKIAIESVGGPNLGFCAGRIDDLNGEWSELLGPTDIQRSTYPCEVNGDCHTPFGSSTIGLIYVNPEGPMGVPDPKRSSDEVRDNFEHMGLTDAETVALIGGGHTIGKAHGACPNGAGPSPQEDPANPWPGACGTGKGNDTFTSGFEGAWTNAPTVWGNEYFRNLLNYNWTASKGPGGHFQWGTPENPSIMMLTTDISLIKDPIFLEHVKQYAENLTLMNENFAYAWYKMTTRDMGPASRCFGPDVLPPQPFQYPLPPPPSQRADFRSVRKAIQAVLRASRSDILPGDFVNGTAYYGSILINLAHLCASSFRVSDYLGGCNGARIRFYPQDNSSLWPMNVAVKEALELLRPIKDQFGEGLTWADLIVFAGTVALVDASKVRIPFCPGRSDAEKGYPYDLLRSRGGLHVNNSKSWKWNAKLSGLSLREAVALSGRIKSPEELQRLGFVNSSWSSPSTLDKQSNEYFVALLGENWQKITVNGVEQYANDDRSKYMTPSDLVILFDSELRSIAQEFASDNEDYLRALSSAWRKLMNIDRFDGPVRNLCDAPSAELLDEPEAVTKSAVLGIIKHKIKHSN